MDVKGITWFSNVYQKFETMCLEVEEAVCQDTVKYVENQVQTVGASVKKFYSEVVDDLLSPSLMDPVKVNSMSCTGAHIKLKMGIKEEPKRQLFEDRNATIQINRFSNTDPAVPCNPVTSTVASKSAGVSPKKLNLVIKRKPKPVIQNSSEVPKAIKIENIEAPIDKIFEEQLDPNAISLDSKETCENQEDFKLKRIPDASAKPVKIILPDGTGTCNSKESDVSRISENEEVFKSMHPADAVNDLTNIPPLDTSSGPNSTLTYEAPSSDADAKQKNASGFSNSYSEEWTAQTGDTDGWNIETITSEDDEDVVEPDAEIMDTEFKNLTVLEESCIIVDRDTLPFYSHKEPKHKSYKKKLREAFASRGKTTIKKEYRQLTAQNESITSLELKHYSASSSLHTSAPETKLESSAQLCDSEWEIL